jgi:hypothetical protein
MDNSHLRITNELEINYNDDDDDDDNDDNATATAAAAAAAADDDDDASAAAAAAADDDDNAAGNDHGDDSFSACTDQDDYCPYLATYGDCTDDAYSQYMEENCRLSCGFCGTGADTSMGMGFYMTPPPYSHSTDGCK